MNFSELIRNAFSSSDSCGKCIVILLIFLSVIVWCVILNHGWMCLLEWIRCNAFLKQYMALKGNKLRISAMMQQQQVADCALRRLCRHGISELQSVTGMNDAEIYDMAAEGVIPRKLTGDEIDRISTTINNDMASQSQNLEGSMVWLGSLASIAPMLGLFGTVWGVMVTFIGIVAAGGRPDIQAIAPGISGALLTTVAGLVVAIPALFANNAIVFCIQKIDLMMDNFTQDFVACLKLCPVSTRRQSPMQGPMQPQMQSSSSATAPAPGVPYSFQQPGVAPAASSMTYGSR